MIDLTTLEGKDTRARFARCARKASAPIRPTRPSLSVAAICIYPTIVAMRAMRSRARTSRSRAVATAFPAGQTFSDMKITETRAAVAGRRRRDRHGHRPWRVPGRRLRPRLRRDRGGQGGVRRRAPEGDPGDRRARDLRQRAPRQRPGHGRRRRLHQDLHRQGHAGRHAAGHAGHARGDPRLPPAHRARGRHEAGGRHPHRQGGDQLPRRPVRDAGSALDDARPVPVRRQQPAQRRADADRKERTGRYQGGDYFTVD